MAICALNLFHFQQFWIAALDSTKPSPCADFLAKFELVCRRLLLLFDSLAAQTHTAFLSCVPRLASGCRAVYDPGGILPFEITPQIDSSSSRCWRAEYLVHSEKFSSSRPSRIWLWIHHEIGTTWPYHGKSVSFEWQFPQARASVFPTTEPRKGSA